MMACRRGGGGGKMRCCLSELTYLCSPSIVCLHAGYRTFIRQSRRCKKIPGRVHDDSLDVHYEFGVGRWRFVWLEGSCLFLLSGGKVCVPPPFQSYSRFLKTLRTPLLLFLTPALDVLLEEVDIIEHRTLVRPRELSVRAVHQLHAVLQLEQAPFIVVTVANRQLRARGSLFVSCLSQLTGLSKPRRLRC